MTAPMYLNRLANVHNSYQRQEEFKRVLCVCSAGLLRSPTAALVLSTEPFGFNTRACGISEEFALVVADGALVEWADEIVCFSPEQEWLMKKMVKECLMDRKRVIMLGIKDNYRYRDPELMKLIAEKYLEAIK